MRIAHENVKRLNEEKRQLKAEKTNRNLKHTVWNRISELPTDKQPTFQEVFPNIDLSNPKLKAKRDKQLKKKLREPLEDDELPISEERFTELAKQGKQGMPIISQIIKNDRREKREKER